MRIGNLLTSALALTNLLNSNKPGAPEEANTNALQRSPVETGLQPTGVGANIPGLDHALGLQDLGSDPSMAFDASSVSDLSGLGEAQDPTALDETTDPSFDPNAQQTTTGPELDQMLDFMRSFVEMLQRMQAEQSGSDDQGISAAGGAGGGGGGGGAPAAMAPQNAMAAPPAAGAAPAAQGAAGAQQPGTPPTPTQGATAQPAQAGVAEQASEGKVAKPPAAAENDAHKPVGETTAAAKPAGANGPNKQYTLDGGGSYTHHLVNNTDKPMDIAYFKNNGPGMQPGFSGESLKVRLQPGETADVSIPDNWQGRAQKYGGKMDDPATWAEFNNEPADASKGRAEAKTWFDVSKIPGGNSNLTMKTGDGVTAGSDHSMLEAAKKDPRAANLLTKDAAGNDVFKPAQGFDGKTNKDVVDFFTEYEPQKKQVVTGTADGKYDNYILPNNDSATRVSQSKEMTLTFGEL